MMKEPSTQVCPCLQLQSFISATVGMYAGPLLTEVGASRIYIVQANSSSALSRSSTRQGLGRQPPSPSRVRSAPSQKGNFSLSGTLEEGTPPVELSSSPPGTATFSRPAWIVPGEALQPPMPPRLRLPVLHGLTTRSTHQTQQLQQLLFPI